MSSVELLSSVLLQFLPQRSTNCICICNILLLFYTHTHIQVRATRKNYKFKTNKRDCFKCAVFVARAHSCFHSFGKRNLNPRLISKLKACLDLMEAHLITPVSNGHKSHTAKNGGPGISNSTALSNTKKRKKYVGCGSFFSA